MIFKKVIIPLFILLSGLFFSQDKTTATVVGTLHLNNHEPLIDVHVTLTKDTFIKETTSDFDGKFKIYNVPFGTYTLKIESLDAETKTITINVNKKYVNVPIRLKENIHQIHEVKVQSKSIKRKIEEKGFAVNVIETQEAALQSIQVNELLDRSSGVRVRQSGGLGSSINYVLNGMSGNSVKIFIDGVPIRNFGSSFSLNSIPPSMIKRIEVYKGVVPAHLSDDAMGGAINIILNNSIKNNLTASISAGSFGTYRGDINGGYRDDETGFTAKGSFFLNYAENNYKVWGDQVAVQLSPGTPDVYIEAERFHDRYRSQGAKAEFGYTNVKWADTFFIGALSSNMDKQVQTGATMEVVYGNRHYKQTSNMYSIDYTKKNIIHNLDVSAFVSYSKLKRKTIDTIATQYSWLGYPTYYYGNPDSWASGAEAGNPTLQTDTDKTVNARSNITYNFDTNHKIQFNHLLNTFTRDSDDPMLPKAENDLKEDREYMKNILSLSLENDFFNKKLKTNIFGKYFLMDRISKIRTRTGNQSNSSIILEENKVNSNDFGFGGAVSYEINKYILVFGSAEKAIRLPDAGEVFGNIAENINAASNLKPERSNNYNLGLTLSNISFKKHAFNLSGNVFIRDTEDLIMQLPVGNYEEFFLNSNVGKIYTKGFDIELNYNYSKMIFFSASSSIFDARDYNVTYDTNGNPITPTYERLPNTPYFTMNYNLRFEKSNFIQKKSKFSSYANLLYVHEFFRHGNVLGGAGKIVIPTQYNIDLGVAYTFPNKKITLSIDAKNILNQQLFDNYALQKPGRGFYGKLTFSIL
ncbi:MAG: TonB-dependent receptor [Flavobacteriales bacterium]